MKRLLCGLALALLMAGCSTPSAWPEYQGELPGEEVAVLEDIRHIPTLGTPHTPYNSVPPTSGPHVPQTVAPGIYREEIPEQIQVHALEHGHVLLQYSPSLPKEQVRQVERLARRYPRDMVVAPYSKLESGLALTAWGRLQRLEAFDEAEIRIFVEALRGRYNHGWTL